MRYFEDFPLGQVDVRPETYLLTEEEIRAVGEQWDPQPFHVDPAAAEASIFGGLVASTVHLYGILTILGHRARSEPVAAVSALGTRSMVSHAPARPGDVLTARATVIEARLSNSRPGLGILTNLAELTNQRDELIFSCEISYLIECRPAGQAGI